MLCTKIREMFQVIDAREWRGLRAFLHRDIVYARPGYPPFEGIDRVIAFYEHERVIAAGLHTLRTIVVDDRHGASWGRFVGTHHNGGPIDEEFADVYDFDGAVIVRRQSFFFRPAV